MPSSVYTLYIDRVKLVTLASCHVMSRVYKAFMQQHTVHDVTTDSKFDLEAPGCLGSQHGVIEPQ